MLWVIVDLLNGIFRIVSVAGVIVMLVAIVGHYVVFGPRHREFAKAKRDVRRFSRWEIFVHAITVLSFIILAVTGFIAVMGPGTLTGWLRFVHVLTTPVFAVGLAAGSITWAEDCMFENYDWEWVKKYGGYLGGAEDVPAGRFNGGQKGFFWAILALGILCMLSGAGRMFPVFGAGIQEIVYLVHRYSSLFLVMFAIIHIYLGTLANPGTWHVIISGYVSYPWAKEHHPIWWQKLDKSAEDK